MDKDDKPHLPATRPEQGKARDATFGTSPSYRHPSFYPPKKEPLLRKRSLGVAVGVVGIAAVGFATLGGKDVQRNSYASQEDCEHDYASGQCARDTATGNGSYSGGYHYYGPWYRSDWRNGPIKGDPGPGRSFGGSAGGGGGGGHGPTGFDFGSRGGFGSSGRVSARGG